MSINDDELDDLKQFIAAMISQSEARLEARLGERIDGVEKKLTGKINALENKMDDGFAGVGEAIDQINKRDAEVNARLSKLETQAA